MGLNRQKSPNGDFKSIKRKCERISAYKRLDLKLNLLFISVLLLNIVVKISCKEEVVNENVKSNDNEVRDQLDEALHNILPDIDEKEHVVYKSVGKYYNNGTFRTGNTLWDGILNQCTVSPSINCLQKNVYTYLERSVGFDGDINVTSGVCFKKNAVDYNKYSNEANIIYMKGSSDADNEEEGRSIDVENEINDEDELSDTPLEEVTDSLYERSVKFMMTHDLRLDLPETFFHGATLKLSPRALTKTGALVHVDIQPKANDVGDGRIFFKKIKKYFKKKLVMAGLAIFLVIKLIKLKLFFVLPLIVGVGAAKKLFLKFVLFIFPALSHIFKLCSWYHQNYHTTKFHHHHHLISHHHHKAQPTPAYSHAPTAHVAYGPPPHSSHGSHLIQQHSAPSFEHYPQDWELSGPGLGSEYLAAGIHRNAIANFKPNADDANDINSWGLGLPPGPASVAPSGYIPTSILPNAIPTIATSGSGYHAVRTPLNGNIGRPMGPPGGLHMSRPRRPVGKDISVQQAEKEALLRAAQLAARAPPSPVRDEVLRVSAAQLAEATRAQAEKKLVQAQQQILAASDPDTIAADRFYGALLEKVDKVLLPIGARDQGCRERAVCSMYRDPIQHTPYSNLVSNELSKDSSELQPPAGSQLALRYYRYVQAARDGQEQKYCQSEYPHCAVDFHKRK